MDEGLSRVQRQFAGTGTAVLQKKIFHRQDYNPELQGQAANDRYHRMRRDPEIYSALATIKAVISGALWQWELPQEVQKNKAAIEQKELCEKYIMGAGRNDSRSTWKGGILPHILLMLDYGMSAMEKVWGVDENGKQGYARLVPILPWTVQEFILGDYGEVARIVQYAYAPNKDGTYTFRRQEIPEVDTIDPQEKIAVFSFRQEGDNYFGESMLRACFEPWYHKSELWMIDAQQKEIAGRGYRIIKIPGAASKGSDAYNSAQTVAETLEMGWAVIGDDWEVETKFPTGTPPDLMRSLEYGDSQIARALGTEFQHLGTTNSGSRSVGDVQSDNMLLKVQAVADLIEEYVNTQLRNPLLRRNYGKVEFPPFLKCEDLLRMKGQDKAITLKALADAGLIKPDRMLEERLRKENDLPEIDDATREEPPDPLALAEAQVAARSQNGNAPDTQRPANQAKPERQPIQRAAGAAPAASAQLFWRDVMPHEAHVALVDVSGYLDREPAMLMSRIVLPYRKEQIRRLAKAATSSSVSDADLAAQRLPHPFETRMATDLATALQDVYLRGRREVVAEAKRQVSLAKVDDAEDESDDYEVAPSKGQLGWIKTIAAGFSAAMLAALVNEAAKSGLAQRQADVTGPRAEAEVMRALDALSLPKVAADLAGAVTRAYTTGRNEQIDAMRDVFDSYYYSAVMDSGTCHECMARDGQEHELDDPNYATPSPYCDGGDRCRCITIAVVRGAEAEQAA